MQQYFAEPGCISNIEMDIRASLAWDLLRTNGILMSVPAEQYDDCGRAVYEPIRSDNLVHRAFDIAETYVDIAERRGYIRPKEPK